MKKIINCMLLSLCLGCANFTLRPVVPAEQLGTYRCTGIISDLIADPFKDDTDYTEEEDTAVVICEWPFLVLDWPFDAIADTIMFPYDYYQYHKNDE